MMVNLFELYSSSCDRDKRLKSWYSLFY